jgi:hypothetical protein
MKSRETAPIPLHGLIKPESGHLVEFGQMVVEHYLMAPEEENPAFDHLSRDKRPLAHFLYGRHQITLSVTDLGLLSTRIGSKATAGSQFAILKGWRVSGTRVSICQVLWNQPRLIAANCTPSAKEPMFCPQAVTGICH